MSIDHNNHNTKLQSTKSKGNPCLNSHNFLGHKHPATQQQSSKSTILFTKANQTPYTVNSTSSGQSPQHVTTKLNSTVSDTTRNKKLLTQPLRRERTESKDATVRLSTFPQTNITPPAGVSRLGRCSDSGAAAPLLEIRTMAITLDKNQEGYFKGDKCRLTGRRDDTTYSLPMVEFIFLDGRFKDEKFWQPE